MKKQYIYPKIIISVTEEDLEKAKVLREKHYINISAFARDQIRNLYNELENK